MDRDRQHEAAHASASARPSTTSSAVTARLCAEQAARCPTATAATCVRRRQHDRLPAPQVDIQLPRAEQRERRAAPPAARASAHGVPLHVLSSPPAERAPAPARAASTTPASRRERGRGEVAPRALRPPGPGRGESTTTRSASRTASSTSWVTSTTVRGSRASAPAASPASRARVIASSAPNGSSRHSSGLPESSVRSERDALAHPARELVRARAARSRRGRARRTARRARRARLRARRAPRCAARARRCRARRATAAADRAGASAPPARSATMPASGALQPADQLQQRALATAARARPPPAARRRAAFSRRRRAPAPCARAWRGRRGSRSRPHSLRLSDRGARGGDAAACAVSAESSLGSHLRSLRGHYPTGSKGRRRGNDPPVRHLSRPSRQPPWCQSMCLFADPSARRRRSRSAAVRSTIRARFPRAIVARPPSPVSRRVAIERYGQRALLECTPQVLARP